MSGKDLFIAIGETDEKIAAKNVSRFNKKISEAERSEAASNVVSAFKIIAGAASVLLIIGFAIFMRVFSERMKDPPDKPAGSEVKTDTEQTKTSDPELSEYNVFVCGDQTVPGLQGMRFCSYYDDKMGEWLSGDGLGISYELIHMSDPPTVYWKSGDAVRFIKDPDPELKYNDTFDLWNNKGSSQISYRETETKNSDALYSYLENNPGEYYITVNCYSYGRTVGGQRESFGYTYGVKLVCAGTASSTETQAPETEETEPTFDNAYDHAGYLIKMLTVSDKDTDKAKELWDALFSLGDEALYYCADSYSLLKQGEKSIVSKFISVSVKDEITGSGADIMGGYSFIGLNDAYSDQIAEWYSRFLISAKLYADEVENPEFAEKLPVTYKILSRIGYMVYNPYKHTLKENVAAAAENENFKPVEIYYTEFSENVYEKELTAEMRADLYDLCQNGSGLEKTVANWTVFRYLLGKPTFNIEFTDILIKADMYEEEREYYTALSKITFEDVKAASRRIDEWVSNIYTAIKAEASALHREEFEEYYPELYKLAEADGFDGYKPGRADIAFRSRKAIKAAEELYRAVQYGDTPEGLIDDTNRYDGINTFDSSELYAYFERYIDKNTVRPYIKGTYAVKIESGKITLRPLAPRLSLYIDVNSAHTVSQSGNKAVIAANVHIPDAMDGYDREMTFEVVDGDDGVIITGGTFAEKMLSPYAEAADSVCRALEAYLILREGQGIYDNAVLYLSDRYFSLNDVPEEYRYLVTDTGKQPLLTLYAHAAEKPGLTTAVSPDIIAELCKITQVYDGALLHPENSIIKTEPAFEHGYYYMTEDGEAYLASIMTVYDVMIGMTVENVTSDRLTVSVDLTSTENGVKKTASYTFELQIGVSKGYDDYDDNGYEANTYTLIGGTFVTELIYGK